MNKKGILIALILVVIAAMVAGYAIANHQSKPEEPVNETSDEFALGDDDVDADPEVEGNGIFFEEEADDANIVKAEAKESDFYGTWEATSDMALYLYGNFEITIVPGGTWKGNITDEDMEGKWRMEGNEMHLVNEWIDVSLAFTTDGTLVMQRNAADEDEEEDMINTVLEKK